VSKVLNKYNYPWKQDDQPTVVLTPTIVTKEINIARGSSEDLKKTDVVAAAKKLLISLHNHDVKLAIAMDAHMKKALNSGSNYRVKVAIIAKIHDGLDGYLIDLCAGRIKHVWKDATAKV